MLQRAAKRADHIFTVSEYSKGRIVEHLGADPDKMTVTYNGVPPHIFASPATNRARAPTRRSASAGNYLLFVGNLKPHKNVSGLLKAFAILRQRGKLDHKLLIIGDDAHWRPLLARQATELGVGDNVVFAGRVDG